MIPFGRAENPITKTNWEGVGVRPDVPVAAASALSVALKKAGSKPVADIAAASMQRVFSPRTTPLPGSEAAVRKLLSAIANGTTIQGIVVPQFASEVEPSLPRRRAELTSLGTLRSVDFYRPDGLGGDEYNLTFANGRRKMALVMGPDGKIVIASSLAPLDPAK